MSTPLKVAIAASNLKKTPISKGAAQAPDISSSRQHKGFARAVPLPFAANPLVAWIAEENQAETQRQEVKRREQEQLELARARFAAD